MYTYVSLSFLCSSTSSLIVTKMAKKTESEEEQARRLMQKRTKTESQNVRVKIDQHERVVAGTKSMQSTT